MTDTIPEFQFANGWRKPHLQVVDVTEPVPEAVEPEGIYRMDCLEGMRKLPPNCIDLVVTDPPYGLSFMGKDWDKAVPSVAIWRECLRVLRLGAFAFIMSARRFDVLTEMGRRIAEAGFRIDFSPIYWTYASGFPKSMNIGKAVDKRLGAEREVIGKGSSGIAKGSDERNFEQGKNAQTYNASTIFDISLPSSPEAKALDGSYAGFQPKPAVEVIIAAMKPLSEKTYVDQALKNGKGITWLDDCRVPLQGDKPREGNIEKSSTKDIYGFGAGFPKSGTMPPEGRFPANLLVSDDALNDGASHKSSHGGGQSTEKTESNFGIGIGGFKSENQYFDSGSFSRFFSLDAWWAERIAELPESVQKTFPFLYSPKASKSEKNSGLDDLPLREISNLNHGNLGEDDVSKRYRTTTRNTHSTVKPLKLMSYLVTLGSRPGDIVLDPFLGSGTTAIAAKLLGRKYVGFELNPEYFEIAKARIAAHPISCTGRSGSAGGILSLSSASKNIQSLKNCTMN